MDGWNTFSFPFGFRPIFLGCELLVLGSVNPTITSLKRGNASNLLPNTTFEGWIILIVSRKNHPIRKQKKKHLVETGNGVVSLNHPKISSPFVRTKTLPAATFPHSISAFCSLIPQHGLKGNIRNILPSGWQ